MHTQSAWVHNSVAQDIMALSTVLHYFTMIFEIIQDYFIFVTCWNRLWVFLSTSKSQHMKFLLHRNGKYISLYNRHMLWWFEIAVKKLSNSGLQLMTTTRLYGRTSCFVPASVSILMAWHLALPAASPLLLWLTLDIFHWLKKEQMNATVTVTQRFVESFQRDWMYLILMIQVTQWEPSLSIGNSFKKTKYHNYTYITPCNIIFVHDVKLKFPDSLS